MSAYYNENDPYAARWLRNLIEAGLVAPGEVDERSVVDIRGEDLRGFDQYHFFAGVGVWSYALRLAAWPDDGPVWTGSCPCQPFSTIGSGGGFDDERHLWPYWSRLIVERGPIVVFGEQVADKDGLAWLDFVCADLEAAGYAVGALSTCAAGVGAPHLRQRLYLVADSSYPERWARERGAKTGTRGGDLQAAAFAGAVGDAEQQRLQGHGGDGDYRHESGRVDSHEARPTPEAGATRGFWADADWLGCTDGKARAVEPGTQPLATGIASRVGRLRAYGNALCAPQAAEFVRAYMSVAT